MRRSALAGLAALAFPALLRAQEHGGTVALVQVASLRNASAPGTEPHYWDRPAVLPGGRIFALAMPERRLASIEARGVSLSARDVALPASIFVPLALAADGRGRLLVLDPSVRRIFRFEVGGSNLRGAGSFAVDEGAADMCAMNGRIYVWRPAAARPLVVYTDGGSPVGAFGQQFGSGSARRRETMSAARVHCSAINRRVFVASNLTGEVQAYDRDGKVEWVHRLPGIVPVPIFDSGGGNVTMVSPPGGYHVLLSLTTLAPGRIVAQYGFRPSGQAAGYRSVTSRTVSLTGTEIGHQDDLPGWVLFVGEDRAASFDQTRGGAALWRIRAGERQE